MDEGNKPSANMKEKLKKYGVLISIFLIVTVLPWFFVDQLFSPGKQSAVPPVKPADLKKYYIGTVQLKNDETKTAILRIYKVEQTSSQVIYYYTMNLNAVEGRVDSLGLIIAKDNRIYAPDMGLLSYERSNDNRIILKSTDQYKRPYWSFEEARQ